MTNRRVVIRIAPFKAILNALKSISLLLKIQRRACGNLILLSRLGQRLWKQLIVRLAGEEHLLRVAGHNQIFGRRTGECGLVEHQIVGTSERIHERGRPPIRLVLHWLTNVKHSTEVSNIHIVAVRSS